MFKMTIILPLDLSKVLLARRFSVVQGVKEDGSPKVRGCDDDTGSSSHGSQ